MKDVTCASVLRLSSLECGELMNLNIYFTNNFTFIFCNALVHLTTIPT